MLVDYLHLPIGDDVPEIVNAVIEIPFGEKNKYEYDKKLQSLSHDMFRLSTELKQQNKSIILVFEG